MIGYTLRNPFTSEEIEEFEDIEDCLELRRQTIHELSKDIELHGSDLEKEIEVIECDIEEKDNSNIEDYKHHKD